MNRKKIFACARYFFTLACFVGTAVPGRSQTSGLDVRPLVQIEEEVTALPPPSPELMDKKLTFISRGGYVFLQGSTEVADGTFGGVAGRGFATSLERVVIRDILTRGQIGLQRDCVFFSTRLSGERRVTWYGRNGRRNAFRVVSAPDLSSGLPACSLQVSALIEGLEAVAGLVVVDGGEFFVTPPGS